MSETKNNGNDKEKPYRHWNVGDGSSRRNNNIETVKKLIAEGLSYNDIMQEASRFFTSKKINEYYSIAMDEMSNSSQSIDSDVKEMEKELNKDDE